MCAKLIAAEPRHTYVSTIGVDMTLTGQAFAGPANSGRKTRVTLDFIGGNSLQFEINDRHLEMLAAAISTHLSKKGV